MPALPATALPLDDSSHFPSILYTFVPRSDHNSRWGRCERKGWTSGKYPCQARACDPWWRCCRGKPTGTGAKGKRRGARRRTGKRQRTRENVSAREEAKHGFNPDIPTTRHENNCDVTIPRDWGPFFLTFLEVSRSVIPHVAAPTRDEATLVGATKV